MRQAGAWSDSMRHRWAHWQTAHKCRDTQRPAFPNHYLRLDSPTHQCWPDQPQRLMRWSRYLAREWRLAPQWAWIISSSASSANGRSALPCTDNSAGATRIVCQCLECYITFDLYASSSAWLVQGFGLLPPSGTPGAGGSPARESGGVHRPAAPDQLLR